MSSFVIARRSATREVLFCQSCCDTCHRPGSVNSRERFLTVLGPDGRDPGAARAGSHAAFPLALRTATSRVPTWSFLGVPWLLCVPVSSSNEHRGVGPTQHPIKLITPPSGSLSKTILSEVLEVRASVDKGLGGGHSAHCMESRFMAPLLAIWISIRASLRPVTLG